MPPLLSQHPLHQWAAALEKDMEAEDVADSSTNMDSDSLDADVDDHMRCEKEFELLVEHMITEELALRTIITNSELLVFASTELPMLYWRFKGKYYLWGVFRPKRDSSRNTMMPNGKSAT
ncbi:protein PARALOG OF AIPP2-like [Lycium barbarum]|uniref:protein PARALOG OF AIPP2-like n=1 Tax=Lycium barbarum TaxID=112863 RepID=UPI00293EB6FA|nr:protein PARALOG OF AIPP2-like [Lycium barbarum]